MNATVSGVGRRASTKADTGEATYAGLVRAGSTSDQSEALGRIESVTPAGPPHTAGADRDASSWTENSKSPACIAVTGWPGPGLGQGGGVGGPRLCRHILSRSRLPLRLRVVKNDIYVISLRGPGKAQRASERERLSDSE